MLMLMLLGSLSFRVQVFGKRKSKKQKSLEILGIRDPRVHNLSLSRKPEQLNPIPQKRPVLSDHAISGVG